MPLKVRNKTFRGIFQYRSCQENDMDVLKNFMRLVVWNMDKIKNTKPNLPCIPPMGECVYVANQ